VTFLISPAKRGRQATPQTDPATQPALRSPGRLALARAGAYLALTKPRVIELLLVSTVPTMLLAAGGLPPLSLVLATLVGGALAAGSANALNCYFDRDIDEVMSRTARRPLPRHAVSPQHAAVFGLALGVLAVSLLWVTTTALAALLALAAILFYVLVYTLLLKRHTPQNIVWGGAAGCMPVLIGWAAVTGELAAPPFVLFLVVFFWTPPHYWPLAMKFRDDYARVGVPMLPVVAAPLTVARQMVAYSWAMVATSLALWPLATGWVYGFGAFLLGGGFLAAVHQFKSQVARGDGVNPMRIFHYSIQYLTLLFVLVAVDVLVR
jgi:protoheme IX farnesyltransferase